MDSIAGVSDYGPSKHAAVGLMRSLRQEVRLLGKQGVHCTTVMPYQINTTLFSGAAIRFKWLPFMNVLRTEDATNRIIQGVERNEVSVYIPKICYFLPLLMAVLPERTFDLVYDFLEVNKAMQRHQAEIQKTCGITCLKNDGK